MAQLSVQFLKIYSHFSILYSSSYGAIRRNVFKVLQSKIAARLVHIFSGNLIITLNAFDRTINHCNQTGQHLILI